MIVLVIKEINALGDIEELVTMIRQTLFQSQY